MWSIVTSQVFICIKTFLRNFLNLMRYSFSVEDFMLMGLCFSVLPLWFIELVKIFDMHKMGWIVQKWLTISTHMSKFYVSKCCQAFLAVKSPFKGNFLYAYSCFCALTDSKSHCFSCQLTKINFGVPMQKHVSLIL